MSTEPAATETTRWRSATYKDGHRKPGTRCGLYGEDTQVESVQPNQWTLPLCGVFQDTLCCKTNDIIPCCPPSMACMKDLIFGNCQHFGSNAQALTGEDPDQTVCCYSCLCVCGFCTNWGLLPNPCMPCYTYGYRAKLRSKFDIPPSCCFFPVPEFCSVCGDYCTHCWCASCSLCQETNEIFARGLRQLPDEDLPADENQNNPLLDEEGGGVSDAQV